MIGFHFQRPTSNWPDAIKKLPSGTWCKSVNDLHLCRDFKKHNPGLKTVYRYEYNGKQHLGDQTDETLKRKARDFFKNFIDNTFFDQELYKHIDAIEEWNEYLADSQSEAERYLWVRWNRAVNEVWTDEYRSDPRLSHIRLVSCNTAIGNSIDPRFAETVEKHDGILGYHNYTKVFNGTITDNDWQDESGRWVGMDALYRSKGITVDWLMTEGGPYLGVYDGWRSSKVYDGDLDKHINEQIKYQIDRCSAWNKVNDGRLLGQVLFTTGNTGPWDDYEYYFPEMNDICEFVANYTPEDVTPDPDPDPPNDNLLQWKKTAWAMSVNEQKLRGIRLNRRAAIQAAIEADGMRIVENELTYQGKTFQAAESYTGSPARRVYVWESGIPVWWFNDPNQGVING